LRQLPPPALSQRIDAAVNHLATVEPLSLEGRVTGLLGLTLEVGGLTAQLSVGDRLQVQSRSADRIAAEVVGFRGRSASAMAFGALDGIGPGAVVRRSGLGGLAVGPDWLGRVVDPFGEPLDGKARPHPGPVARAPRASPPPAAARARLGPRIDLGVRALNAFATCRQGQRLGLFAGSGVGKSTLMSMLARRTACDVAVISLVGERGREVREFIEDDLGPEGLARSVVVVATSDQPPLMRREAAYASLAVAEAFRDQGLQVLLLMDSVTRYCLALREIALSAGEPPATRGYPPSVFAELPRLLERAGPGIEGSGSITALFTVLVEGDDHNEPISDAVRGILDGHVVLDRRIAEGGRYPAIDVLKSLSRAAHGANAPEENALVLRARRLLATWGDMADMVRLGAYKPGSDASVDEAVRLAPRIEAFLTQARDDATGIEESFALLAKAVAG